MTTAVPPTDQRLTAAYIKSTKLLLVPIVLAFLAAIILLPPSEFACNYVNSLFGKYAWPPNYFFIDGVNTNYKSACSVMLLRSASSSALFAWLIFSVFLMSSAVKKFKSASLILILSAICTSSFYVSSIPPIQDIDVIRPSYRDPWAISSIKHLIFVFAFYFSMNLLIFTVRCALKGKGAAN